VILTLLYKICTFRNIDTLFRFLILNRYCILYRYLINYFIYFDHHRYQIFSLLVLTDIYFPHFNFIERSICEKVIIGY